jgi:hypothetical protein
MFGRALALPRSKTTKELGPIGCWWRRPGPRRRIRPRARPILGAGLRPREVAPRLDAAYSGVDRGCNGLRRISDFFCPVCAMFRA